MSNDEFLSDLGVIWSDWAPFGTALATAPRLPGVYIARERHSQNVIYVGMAGERRGQGIRGRLAAYLSGKGLVSGLGEGVFNRALADPDWLSERLEEAKRGHVHAAKAWGAMAFERADLQIRWTTTSDRRTARGLEINAVAVLRPSLWNK